MRDGTITTGQLVQLCCQRFVNDYDASRDPEFPYYFDADAAQHALSFFGFLRHLKGEWAGQPFKLQGWQAFVVASVFGWCRRTDSTRRYRVAMVETARKAGKSTLAAAVGLYLFCADGEPGAEVCTASTKRDQSRIVHSEAVRMVASSPHLRGQIQTFKDRLVMEEGASTYVPLGQDADTLEGLNLHGFIADEVQSWTNRKLWDVLITSTGARRQPLAFAISTAGAGRTNLLWTLHQHAIAVLEGREADPTLFAYIATPDPGDDPFDTASWQKANPGLGITVKYENLAEQAEVAKQIPSQLNSFLRYRLNVWTEQHTEWIPMTLWDENAVVIDYTALENRECIGGLDLGSTRDLTALVLLFPEKDGGYIVLPHFWMPEANVQRRVVTDRVPYDVWIRQGLVKTTEGNSCDYDVLHADICELSEKYRISQIGFDRWNATQLVTQLQSDGANMVPVGMGYASMSAPTRECEKLLLNRRLHHDGNEVMRWMMGNVAIKTDPAGNQKPDRERSTEKIDGVSAMLLGLARCIVTDFTSGSVYDTWEPVVLGEPDKDDTEDD